MNIKKITALLLAVTIIGVSFPVFLPAAEIPAIAGTDGTYGNYNIIKYNDHVEISKYTGNASNVTIPSEIDGLPVTCIGKLAFFHNKSITTIIIPDSVTSIENEAFSCCYNLTSITIPDSVTSIGYESFSRTGIESITIPDSVTYIGGRAFYPTTWIKNKQKENPLVIVNDILIDGTTCSEDITIPDNVKLIAYGAFSQCKNLTSVTIPDSVTSIEGNAFEYCSNLASITIPDSVKYIGGRAFYDTQWLKNKQKQDPLVIINDILVDGTTCSGDVIIPYSITSINRYVFELSHNLTSITIMNPDCSIEDHMGTISNWHDNDNQLYMYDGVIKGYSGSTAEAYAKKYNRTFAALEQDFTLGDVTLDGIITGSDATYVLQAYTNISSGQDSGLDDIQFRAADVTGDGIITGSDATYILQYYTELSAGGNTDNFPPLDEWIKNSQK